MANDTGLAITKDCNTISTSLAGDDPVSKGHVSKKYIGTLADQQDMLALGKDQVLRVSYLAPDL